MATRRQSGSNLRAQHGKSYRGQYQPSLRDFPPLQQAAEKPPNLLPNGDEHSEMEYQFSNPETLEQWDNTNSGQWND